MLEKPKQSFGSHCPLHSGRHLTHSPNYPTLTSPPLMGVDTGEGEGRVICADYLINIKCVRFLCSNNRIKPWRYTVDYDDKTCYCNCMPDENEIREEEKKLRQLRLIISLTTAVIAEGDLSLKESLEMIKGAKRAALSIFPDKEGVFDLIYMPRFRRLLNEVYGRH